MSLSRLKKMWVIALVLLPLSLSGCKKDSVEQDVDSSGESVEQSTEETVADENTVVEEDINEKDANNSSNIVMEFEEPEEVRDLPKDAEVHFIPVGLGESVLLRDHDEYMLVDAGGNKGATLNYLKNLGVKNLRYLVLTQWDNDSLNDVEGILNSFNIHYIIAPTVKSTAHPMTTRLTKLLDEKGMFVTIPKSTKVDYKIGESTFSLLNRVANYDTEDDNSLGVAIDIKDTKIFISSDSSKNQEEVKGLGDIDIYSVAKHGDSSINTEDRLKTLNPEFVVIPTDTKTTIDSSATENILKGIGSKVYKTTDGAIVYKITDDGITVNR